MKTWFHNEMCICRGCKKKENFPPYLFYTEPIAFLLYYRVPFEPFVEAEEQPKYAKCTAEVSNAPQGRNIGKERMGKLQKTGATLRLGVQDVISKNGAGGHNVLVLEQPVLAVCLSECEAQRIKCGLANVLVTSLIA